jgi:hypothetical protein
MLPDHLSPVRIVIVIKNVRVELLTLTLTLHVTGDHTFTRRKMKGPIEPIVEGQTRPTCHPQLEL